MKIFHLRYRDLGIKQASPASRMYTSKCLQKKHQDRLAEISETEPARLTGLIGSHSLRSTFTDIKSERRFDDSMSWHSDDMESSKRRSLLYR